MDHAEQDQDSVAAALQSPGGCHPERVLWGFGRPLLDGWSPKSDGDPLPSYPGMDAPTDAPEPEVNEDGPSSRFHA